jgi:hypothetical protein
VFEEVQCNLYILQLVESHAAFLSGLEREREEREREGLETDWTGVNATFEEAFEKGE